MRRSTCCGHLLVGFWFDLAVLLVMLIPSTLYWALLPQGFRGGRFDRVMTYAGFATFVFITGFTLIGEVLFWNEFGARFNFIAVDYLVYTREVAANIWESYPVGKMLAVLVAAALALTFLLRRPMRARTRSRRLCVRALWWRLLLGGMRSWSTTSRNPPGPSSPPTATPTSCRGTAPTRWCAPSSATKSIIGASIAVNDERAVNDRIRELVASPNARFVGKLPGDITRDIVQPGIPLRKNVVMITVESLSADFMAHFGNRDDLTPNLDALADQSLLFTRMLATGTRTVRGLEAVTLSVPPTPGQSILRRPGNEHLFSLGSVLRDHGYSSTFLYGGDGLFDNMNAFFSANGYRRDRPQGIRAVGSDLLQCLGCLRRGSVRARA